MSSSKGTPAKALVIATLHWPSTTRLCLALTRRGMLLAAVAPADHGMRRLKAVAAHYPCNRYAVVTPSILEAIEAWSPDILIPCDDPALACLHELHAQSMRGDDRQSRRIAGLIEASLGDAASFPITCSKSEFMAYAAAEGIAVPETVPIRDRKELHARLGRAVLPQVLKADGSWGGLGVRVIRRPEEAGRGFSELLGLSGWQSMAKRTFKTLSVGPVRHWLKGAAPSISLQRYIEGRPANRAILCWQGEVLAGVSVEALQTSRETGPATVVRVIDRPEMARVAAHIARRLRLSGFIGFDFVLETATNRPYLIEMNSRPTPICHFSFGAETDMPGALAAKLSGRAARRIEKTASGDILAQDVVALFPQELWRDPCSAYLRSSYHDVPWEEPQFVSAYALPVPAEPPVWFGRWQTHARAGAWRPREESDDAKDGDRSTAVAL